MKKNRTKELYDGLAFLLVGMVYLGFIVVINMHAPSLVQAIVQLWKASPLLFLILFLGPILSLMACIGRVAKSHGLAVIGFVAGLTLLGFELAYAYKDSVPVEPRPAAIISPFIIPIVIHLILLCRYRSAFRRVSSHGIASH